jgi:signal peptidase I
MTGSSGKIFREVMETLLIALVLAFLVRTFVVESFLVDGRSMQPTLQHHERLFVNKLGYRIGSPERGDIIVFRYPKDPSRDFIKRIIGLPGDEIEIRSGVLYINGQRYDEPYILEEDPRGYLAAEIPEGEFFVMGDNRRNSEDSRFFGTVPIANIKGKALLVYWPLEDLRLLTHE